MPIVFCVYNHKENIKVFRNCRNLKESNIAVANDCSQSSSSKQKQLWDTVIEDDIKNSGAKLAHDKLLLHYRFYTWDDAANCSHSGCTAEIVVKCMTAKRKEKIRTEATTRCKYQCLKHEQKF